MAVLDPNEIMFTAFEPKVQNRFLMYIDGIPTYMATLTFDADTAGNEYEVRIVKL